MRLLHNYTFCFLCVQLTKLFYLSIYLCMYHVYVYVHRYAEAYTDIYLYTHVCIYIYGTSEEEQDCNVKNSSYSFCFRPCPKIFINIIYFS